MLPFDPDFSVLEKFLFPDRNNLLQAIDRIFTGIERCLAVWGRDDDGDAGLSNIHMPKPVDNRDAADIPGFAHEFSDLFHLRERHGFVSFVFEVARSLSLGVVSDDTLENAKGAVFGPEDQVGDVASVDRFTGKAIDLAR